MNRQTKFTLFLVSCIFALKLGIIDMPVLGRHLAMIHEKLQTKPELIIEQQKEKIPPNYAVLIQTRSQFVDDGRLKENTAKVLVDLVRDNYSDKTVPIEHSQCRDP